MEPTPAARAARSLPIHTQTDEIVQALSQHRVVVIEGPTGCGKTTQLPQILLRSALAPRRIGVTQPRRIAAVSVAWRIAAEMGTEVGKDVGYAIRFDDQTSQDTVIKVMTDGILLQEARGDALFEQYDVVMVDEAHERSLNIDLTLGLLYRALQKRDDLRVVVSSATLQPEVFQRFFKPVAGEVPLISVKARVHPIEIVHRAPSAEWYGGVVEEAVADEIMRLHRTAGPGHILVFMTGEGMIRNTEIALMRRNPGTGLLVMPLYGRLTREEQEQVFDDVGDRRKVVLATNIAETSITIPDVRYVIDTGLAKIPRFDGRTGITTLQEEPISRASLDQRAGRAGRTAPGIALRMYDSASLHKRPAFTEEEILRQDLSELVLRLIDLGIKDVEDFPLPTKPPRNRLRGALGTLQILGAIDPRRDLTEVGRRMVPFPLEPRLSRIIVEAAETAPNVVDDVLIVGAFLSSRTPFLFPPGEEDEAREAQRQAAHPLGDALTAVTLFRRWEKANDRAAFCQRGYLDPDIMGFVAKARGQLAEIAQRLGVHAARGGKPEDVARAVAAGFPDRLIWRRGRHYETTTGARVLIHPSSALFGSHPQCAVAAELVRSTRVYARNVTAVDPRDVPRLNEEAARLWHIETRGRRGHDLPAAEPARAPSVPTSLTLRGVRLEVRARRDKVRVDIPLEAVGRLAGLPLSDLPDAASDWRGQVTDGRDRYLSRLSLTEVICLLPHVPLPEPGGEPLGPRVVPQGALLDPERNLHTLERFLGHVLSPARPMQGKRPGWLMLVSNRADGFWFEVSPDWIEALEVTIEALDTLLETLPDGDALADTLRQKVEDARARHEASTRALLAARRGRRQERSRH